MTSNFNASSTVTCVSLKIVQPPLTGKTRQICGLRSLERACHCSMKTSLCASLSNQDGCKVTLVTFGPRRPAGFVSTPDLIQSSRPAYWLWHFRLETMEGKAMAIDSSIWIYQFQATMRDKEGRGLVNAHVLGFLRRICKLLFYGIKPVFVFDGGAPALKRATIVSQCYVCSCRYMTLVVRRSERRRKAVRPLVMPRWRRDC